MNSATPDNANPVVHSTASFSGSRKLKSTAFLDLDFQDDQEWETLEKQLSYGQVDKDSHRVDDLEEIDQDEIFGEQDPSSFAQKWRCFVLFPLFSSPLLTLTFRWPISSIPDVQI
jgi:hypothetical protein